MAFTFDFDLARFTPAEAESITNTSTAAQRDLRRRGFMPSTPGSHARFSVFELARMLFIHVMSARGIGPSEAAGYVDFAMNGIAFHALQVAGASDGDEYPTGVRAMAGSVLQKTSPAGRRLSSFIPVRALVIFADGTEFFAPTVEYALEEAERQGKRREWLTGPVTFLDLQILGEELAARAGRPLVRVFRVEGI